MSGSVFVSLELDERHAQAFTNFLERLLSQNISGVIPPTPREDTLTLEVMQIFALELAHQGYRPTNHARFNG